MVRALPPPPRPFRARPRGLRGRGGVRGRGEVWPAPRAAPPPPPGTRAGRPPPFSRRLRARDAPRSYQTTPPSHSAVADRLEPHAGQPRVGPDHRDGDRLRRLLGVARPPADRRRPLVLLRLRGLAHRQPEQRGPERLAAAGERGPGRVAPHRPRPALRDLHARVLAPPALHVERPPLRRHDLPAVLVGARRARRARDQRARPQLPALQAGPGDHRVRSRHRRPFGAWRPAVLPPPERRPPRGRAGHERRGAATRPLDRPRRLPVRDHRRRRGRLGLGVVHAALRPERRRRRRPPPPRRPHPRSPARRSARGARDTTPPTLGLGRTTRYPGAGSRAASRSASVARRPAACRSMPW